MLTPKPEQTLHIAAERAGGVTARGKRLVPLPGCFPDFGTQCLPPHLGTHRLRKSAFQGCPKRRDTCQLGLAGMDRLQKRFPILELFRNRILGHESLLLPTSHGPACKRGACLRTPPGCWRCYARGLAFDEEACLPGSSPSGSFSTTIGLRGRLR